MIAALLVDTYGLAAIAVAQERAGRALGEKDYPSYLAWTAVMAAAQTYLRTARERGEIRQ